MNMPQPPPGGELGGGTGAALLGAGLILVAAVLVYAIRVTAGTGRRPTSPHAKAIERSVTIATRRSPKPARLSPQAS